MGNYRPYYSAPGTPFPTHVCTMGHCTRPSPDHGWTSTYPATPAELLILCGCLVYKESGLFSHHCENKVTRMTPELEAAYRLGGEWAVQDALGVLPNSVQRRWI